MSKLRSNILNLIFMLIFSVQFLYAQNTVKKVYYDASKTQLKEEYHLNDKHKKTLEGLYTAYYANGKVKMRGYFKNNLHFGTWKFFYENGGKKSEGSYINNQPQGIWKYYYENQNLQMLGKLLNGQRDSTWNFYFENQIIKSIGEYDSGAVTGQWKYFYEDGKVKGEAILEDNNGWYKEYYTDGKLKMEGNLVDGQSDSLWTYYHENGNIKSIGNEKNGLKNGLWTYYHSNKNVAAQGSYVNGVQTGNWKYYFETSNRLSSQGDMNEGKKEGRWLSYYEIGTMKGESNFHNGDGPYKEYYSNGKLKIEGYIKQEKNHGLWTYYYESGEKEADCDFVDGEGLYRGYFPDGKLKTEGVIKDGNKLGSWKIYGSDGSVIGYYKAIYDKEPEKPFVDTFDIKDTVVLKITQKKEVQQKKIKKRHTRFFNPALNQYNTMILSLNPFSPLIKSTLPFYAEYYMEEKIGFELNFNWYKVPFFASKESQGKDKIFTDGYSVGFKQRFYRKLNSYGMLYYAYELKYLEFDYQSFVDDGLGGINSLTAHSNKYQFTAQIGDRILKATDKPGFTMDVFFGLGIGISKYEEKLDNQSSSFQLFSKVRQNGFYIPVQLGFSIGYIL